MRLAVFTNQFPSKVSTFFARDMCALMESGVDIEVFSIYPPDNKLWQYVPDLLNESVFPKANVHHFNFKRDIRYILPFAQRNLKIFFQEMFSISASAVSYGAGPFLKSLYVFPLASVWAREHKNRFDHVWAYWGNYAGTCAYLFHRLIKQQIPYSFILHASIDLYRNKIYLREKMLYADKIFVVCDYNRQHIKKHFPDIFSEIAPKIHIHHPGLELSEFPYKSNGRPANKVIAVGRLELTKGYDYLLRATRELKNRGIKIEVELVGDGSQAEPLQNLANNLEISDQVHFRGWLNFDQVRDAISNATILVHPSPFLGDATPTVIKEAMALGTPVVASEVVGIPELLDYGRCGVLVPKRDVEKLASSIDDMIADVAKRKHYSKVAREYAVDAYDHMRNGKRLAEILCSTRRNE